MATNAEETREELEWQASPLYGSNELFVRAYQFLHDYQTESVSACERRIAPKPGSYLGIPADLLRDRLPVRLVR